MDRAEVAIILHAVKTAYPTFGGSNSSDDVVSLWAEMLSDIEFQDARDAVKAHIRNSRFPPTIAEIRELVDSLESDAVTAGDIWAECQRLLGWSISPDDSETAYSKMSNVCREAVLACGGWKALSMSDESDPHVKRLFFNAAEVKFKRDRAHGIAFDTSRVNKLLPANNAGIPCLTGGGVDG